MVVLGLETSCDETSAAVVRDGRSALSNIVASQADLHAKYGGVVPEVASRRHVERMLPVIDEALAGAGMTLAQIEGIAVTNRPGLIGALLVGVSGAKALGYALGVPVVGVHHLVGHLVAAEVTCPGLSPPYTGLLVSGGHTEVILVESRDRYRCLGRTRDDAAGECLDKCARLLGLPYPGGPHIERCAASGDASAVAFPRAWLGSSCDFSFSGLKTAVARFVEADRGSTSLADIAASLQGAVVDVLVRKTVQAARAAGVPTVVIGGGVAANRSLVSTLSARCEADGLRFVAPQIDMCTDNAAMIAAAGWHRLRRGENDLMGLDTFAAEPLG